MRWKCTVAMVVGLSLAVLAAASCGGDGAAVQGPTPNPAGDVADLAIPATDAVNDGNFATSLVCAECHSNSSDADAMRDEDDREIGFFDLWQSTMMANASRDPLWRAMVSAEIAATPAAKDVIEAKCMRCHAPAASAEAELDGQTVALSLLQADQDRAHFARDGVTCTVCHQIEPAGLGTTDSFSGGFVIEATGNIYGPHDDNFVMPMQNRTGFTPMYATHTTSSEMCASCHTLFTTALSSDGVSVGANLPEQTPYLEWKNSVYSTTEPATCQDCHVPRVSEDGVALEAMIARNPGGFDFPSVGERSPYGRHVFVGGNTWIPAVLREFADILKPLASDGAFEQTIAAARNQLGSATATVAIEELARSGSELSFAVRISNLGGHKFPTGFPARRAWLEVVVTDSEGARVFASGTVDAMGRLVDGDGIVLAEEQVGGPTLPHRDQITASDQVYAIEAVMADAEGTPTYTLLRAASYHKDDRLLPRGWSDSHPDVASIAPVGVAADADFAAGGDVVHYRVSAPASGAAKLDVRLLYQPLSARFAAELFQWNTPETAAFRVMLETVKPAAEVVASASATAN